MEKENPKKYPRFGTVSFERRRHPRFSLNLPVEYWLTDDSKSHPGRAENISEGGILLYLPEEIEIGKRLRLKLFFDSNPAIISIEAFVEVIWKEFPWGEKGEHRIGVKFINISEEDMANLRKYLNDLVHSKNNPKTDIPPRLLAALGLKTPDPD